MNFKSLRQTAFLSIMAALIAISVLSAATFAWFSFSNDTNVTPISGTVSRGDGSLLISASPVGPFDVSCTLPYDSAGGTLYPLSTVDLNRFFIAAAEHDGIVTSYRAATDEDVIRQTLHGRVFLKAETVGSDVYFWPESLAVIADGQALAALRLGLRFSTVEGTHTYIFRLDEFGSTLNAEAQQTVAARDAVVNAIDGDGLPQYAQDPAALTAPYRAAVTDDDIAPGAVRLCTLGADEIGTVEYWLYLEGCDENCIRAVQGRDVALQLGFAGVND